MIKDNTKGEMFDNENNSCYEPGQDETSGQAVPNDTADNMAEEGACVNDNTSSVSDEAAEWKDKYTRLAAEFDNYRRRTLKEKMELLDTGCEDVIKSLLNVIDDIDRAMNSIESSDNAESLKEGVTLIYNKLMDVLRSKGVKEIEAVGKELDTDEHEAIAKLPVSCEMKGKVVDVVQKGYKLKDKVVRYAKVVVGE